MALGLFCDSDPYSLDRLLLIVDVYDAMSAPRPVSVSSSRVDLPGWVGMYMSHLICRRSPLIHLSLS